MAKINLNEYLERLEEPEDREVVANRAYQRQLFLDYVVRGGNFPEQRAQLLRDFQDGKELAGPKGLRRSSGQSTLNISGGPTSPTTSSGPPRRSTENLTGYGGRA